MSLPRGRLALTVRRVVAAETCKASEPSSIAQSTSVPSPLLRAPITAASRSEEHTSELQSLMRISYAVFCLKKKKNTYTQQQNNHKTIINHCDKTPRQQHR